MAGQHDHGHTPAAWTAVTIAFIGFCLGSYFTVVAQPWGVAASGLVLVLAAVVGVVMRAMGLGQQPAPARTAGAAVAARAPEAEVEAAPAAEPEVAAEPAAAEPVTEVVETPAPAAATGEPQQAAATS